MKAAGIAGPAFTFKAAAFDTPNFKNQSRSASD